MAGVRPVTGEPRIAIVGAGLAGLTCAHRLHLGGLASTMYEARDRVGGRCWSSRGWDGDQVGEHGGETIYPEHHHLLRVIRGLGLELEDRWEAVQNTTLDARFVLSNRTVRLRELDGGFRRVARRLAQEHAPLADPSPDRAAEAARRIDEMTVAEWIDENVDGGLGSDLGRGLALGHAVNYGFDPRELSAMALFQGPFVDGDEAGRPAEEAAPSYAETIEAAVSRAFHVRGGNDLVARRLAAGLPEGTVRLEAPLLSLRRRREGGFALRTGDSSREVLFDRVVLAIPFSTLRAVDLEDAGISGPKRRCIDELPMGGNTKLLMQFHERPQAWGFPGSVSTDEPELTVWETSLAQPGPSGLLTLFTARKVFPTEHAHAEASAAAREHGLSALDSLVPGSLAAFSGRAWLDSWPDDPWSRGSYAGFGPGQFVPFRDLVGEQEDGVHFAGEHTSKEFQGYLTGAVESGERCARELIQALTRPPTRPPPSMRHAGDASRG